MAVILFERYDLITGEYLNEGAFFEEGEQPEGYTSVSKGNFVRPFFNLQTNEAYEGATQQEIDDYISVRKTDYNERLQEYVLRLRERTLVSSLNKKESKQEYLKEQKPIYKMKYDVAKNFLFNLVNPILNNTWYDAIDRERLKVNLETGTTYTIGQYMDKICTEWETSEERYNQFHSAVEEWRVCTDIFIEKAQFNRTESSFALMDTLPDNVDSTVIEDFRTQMNNI
jgi:hypothetical protein